MNDAKDTVTTAVRNAGGIGTLTWIAFLPFSLTFGLVANDAGVHTADWIFIGASALAAVCLLHLNATTELAQTTNHRAPQG